MTPAVEIQGLAKRYGKVQALKDVNLVVERGCIYGILGPNGAGKSTLIKTLVGTLKADDGSVRVLGHAMPRSAKAARRRIGYMPQVPALYGDLNVRANIAFFARAHRIERLDERVSKVIDFVGLSEKTLLKVDTLSGGQKQRCSLACALVHDPELLILDEPTAGVDPVLKQTFWRHFHALAHGGITILIATHLMDEPLLCDHVGILREGRLIVEDTPQNILARGESTVTLKIGDALIERRIASDPGALSVLLSAYGLKPEVKGISVRPADLEEVFLQLLEKTAHDT